jgi:hypothetical protein
LLNSSVESQKISGIVTGQENKGSLLVAEKFKDKSGLRTSNYYSYSGDHEGVDEIRSHVINPATYCSSKKNLKYIEPLQSLKLVLHAEFGRDEDTQETVQILAEERVFDAAQGQMVIKAKSTFIA